MRKDADKILHIKPRMGHKSSFKDVRHAKRFQYNEKCEQQNFESMNYRYKINYNTKRINLNYTHVLRFLEKSIGKSWNNVLQEIMSAYKNDTNQYLIKKVISRYVYINDLFVGEDNGIYNFTFSNNYRIDHTKSFYIHPTKNILCKGKVVRKKKKSYCSNTYYVDNGILQKINGIWFIYKLKRNIPQVFICTNEDGTTYEYFKMNFCLYRNTSCIRSDSFYAYSKKQMSSKLLNFYNLSNDIIN